MIKNKVSVFLPIRKGSQRVVNKNTRKFAHFNKGLLELKLNQLIKVTSISEIILSTNDEASIEIGREFSHISNKIRIIKRPENLSLSSTNLTDLVKYVPKICVSDHILWTHVTSPFVEAVDYDYAIELYLKALNQGYDSLMSVRKFNNYLWSKKKNDIINRVSDQRWPQTQDLEELYEINSAIFIASRKIYVDNFDRIGTKPELFIQDSIKSFDIDWEDDFTLAELIYKKNNEY
jgi:CMP-N-acetylneuraminic acid synthetase